MDIRPARAEEADALSALAQRAKAHWGYDQAFLDACREELTYPGELVGAGGFFVVEDAGEVRGFYALAKVSPTAMELDAVFVEPDHIGQGYGRALLDHAIAEAGRHDDIERLVIQADPHAADFYEAAGAVRIGERESGSIPGRLLPLYEIPIER
jgi:N-acetylglutamate synthase-like GNAT family acetyltransferase